MTTAKKTRNPKSSKLAVLDTGELAPAETNRRKKHAHATTEEMMRNSKHRIGVELADTLFRATPKLLGEVVTWDCGGLTLPFGEIRAKLAAEGLPESVAREMLPRNAFCRGCQHLAERRIIRLLDEDRASMTFQFTREEQSGDRYEYDYEAKLTLDKATGKVACSENPTLAVEAQRLLDDESGKRHGSDLSQIVSRLINQECTIFPIRRQGGCYFIPAQDVGPLDAINRFVAACGAHMGRFPVPAGTPHGDSSVRDAVRDGVQGLIDIYRGSVDGIDAETGKRTLKSIKADIDTARFMLESYGEYLMGERERIEAALAETQEMFKAKVAQVLDKAEDIAAVLEPDVE